MALRLNPSDTRAIVFRGRYDMLTGDSDACMEYIELAKRYNPYARYHLPMGLALFTSRQYDAALNEFDSIRNPHAIVDAFRAATMAHLGLSVKAAQTAEVFLSKVRVQRELVNPETPEHWVTLITERYPYKKTSDMDHLVEGLRKAGIPE